MGRLIVIRCMVIVHQFHEEIPLSRHNILTKKLEIFTLMIEESDCGLVSFDK